MRESMEAESKENIGLFAALHNNIYVMKLGSELSTSRVIHALFMKILYYFDWIFFNAYFLKYIVNALDTGEAIENIFLFILVCGFVFICINLYRDYVDNVVVPLTDAKIYHGVYKRLYKKARNVELRCYENADFYKRYTMALDDAGTKITTIVDSFFGIFTGAVGVVIVFYAMYEIAPLSVLFIISPMIGNFVFGAVWNRLLVERYQAAMEFIKNELTFTVIFEGVMFYAVYENLVTKQISLAGLTVMTSLMVSATWILIGLFENIMNMVKNGMFIRNLRTFLEYEEEIPEDYDGLIADQPFEILEFENVSFSYQKEETIKDISFTIKKGEAIALVGHNGAGKSTIIKLILRYYDPTSGVIRLNGVDIRKYNLRSYRKLFATAFQDVCILGMTVKDNILLGEKSTPENEERVATALKKAGIYERIESLPKGIHTMMTKEFDEEGVVLSGGESQKVAVARAFYRICPIKIFDEPSSALDPIAEYELFQSIMQERRQNTMIFISHRLSSVKNVDYVLMLEHGQIIERGTHKELMQREGSYATMYRKQARNYQAIDSVEEMAL